MIRFIKLLTIILLLAVVLTACSPARAGDQINTQTVLDASRTQNSLLSGVIMNAQPIISYFFNENPSVFTNTQINVLLTEEIANTQDAIHKLEKYNQPKGSLKEVQKALNALSFYKSSLVLLRTSLENGDQILKNEQQQFLDALSLLQSSFYLKP